VAFMEIRRGSAGVRYHGCDRGCLYALAGDPLGADAELARAAFTAFVDVDQPWEDDFEAMVAGLVRAMGETFGEPVVTAPSRSVDPLWWGRLRRFLTFQGQPTLADAANPGGLSPVAALTSAARDGRSLAFASVAFGRSADRRDALVFASEGRPMLWVWLRDDVTEVWPALSQAAAGDLPCTEAPEDLDSAVPPIPGLSRMFPHVSFHRGDAVRWTDGTHRLQFNAALGVDPPEVYVPTDRAWRASVPGWAAALRGTMVADLREAGATVVEEDRALR